MNRPRRTIRVAIDALGGGRAPLEPVRAAAQLSRETTIAVTLVGPLDALRSQLDQLPHDPSRIHLCGVGSYAEARIGRERIRAQRDNLEATARLVAAGEADALVTASGAPIVVRTIAEILPRIPGVTAPALAAVYPTRERSFSNDRFALLLDVGATVHCTSDDLVGFAHMGHAYARCVSKVPAPAVALLNIRDEAEAGDEVLTRAYGELHRDARLNFIGNIDGADVPRGIADVVVCEGLVGNVLAKLATGLADALASMGSWAFKQSLLWRLGLTLLSRGVRQMKAITDYREYAGAPYLGFQQMVLKTHSQSHANAIANAAKVAAKAVRDDVVGDIARALEKRA